MKLATFGPRYPSLSTFLYLLGLDPILLVTRGMLSPLTILRYPLSPSQPLHMERVKSLRPMKVEFKHLGLILLVFMGSSPHMTMAMSNILSFDPSNSRTRINSTFDISIVPSGEHQYHGATATLDNANTLWLIPDPSETNNHNLSGGRIVSKESIEFSSHTTGAIVSFNTSFSFRIVTQSNESGEGMAFFIAQDKTFPHSSAGAYLGLSNGTLMENTSFPGHKFFAVEFDISQSPQFDDPSSSHVGIDINSLQSIQTLDTSGIAGLSLLRNFSFQAWIEFNASTSLVQVWLMNYEESTDYANSLDRKDQSPVLQASIDPSVFQDTSMATSGSTGDADIPSPLAMLSIHGTSRPSTRISSWTYLVSIHHPTLVLLSLNHDDPSGSLSKKRSSD